MDKLSYEVFVEEVEKLLRKGGTFLNNDKGSLFISSSPQRDKGIVVKMPQVYQQYLVHSELDVEETAFLILSALKDKTEQYEDNSNSLKKFVSFEEAQGHLILRGIPLNPNILKDAASYKIFGDIAVVVCFLLGSNSEEKFSSAIVTSSMMEPWKKTPVELYQEAEKRTLEKYTPCAASLENLFWGKLEFYPFMKENQSFPVSLTNCICCQPPEKGAVVLFIPEVAKRISDILDSNYYIAFTSVHEAMVHSCKYGISPEDIQKSLKGTLEAGYFYGDENDKLSQQIYFYDRQKEEISVVTE